MIIIAKNAFQRTIKHVVHCHQNYLVCPDINIIWYRRGTTCTAKPRTGTGRPALDAGFPILLQLLSRFHFSHICFTLGILALTNLKFITYSYFYSSTFPVTIWLSHLYKLCSILPFYKNYIQVTLRGLCPRSKFDNSFEVFNIFPIANNIFLRFSIHLTIANNIFLGSQRRWWLCELQRVVVTKKHMFWTKKK